MTSPMWSEGDVTCSYTREKVLEVFPLKKILNIKTPILNFFMTFFMLPIMFSHFLVLVWGKGGGNKFSFRFFFFFGLLKGKGGGGIWFGNFEGRLFFVHRRKKVAISRLRKSFKTWNFTSVCNMCLKQKLYCDNVCKVIHFKLILIRSLYRNRKFLTIINFS